MIKSLILVCFLLLSPVLTEKDFLDCINIFRFLNGKPDMVVVKSLDGFTYKTRYYEDSDLYLNYDTINIVKVNDEFLIKLK